jgi:hypothetical protein
MIDEKELEKALSRLRNLRLDRIPRGFNTKKSNGYESGNENAPFFSEAFLYNLLGKDDARTILSAMEKLFKAAGDTL